MCLSVCTSVCFFVYMYVFSLIVACNARVMWQCFRVAWDNAAPFKDNGAFSLVKCINQKKIVVIVVINQVHIYRKRNLKR